MTKRKLKKALLKSQQGELDAVAMYQKLAKVAKNEDLKEAFSNLAAEEGRHAAVFYQFTKQKLEPKQTKAIAVPALQKVIGWKRVLKIIANAEYSAYDKYEPLVKVVPEVSSVRDDEKRHGDIVMGLIEKV